VDTLVLYETNHIDKAAFLVLLTPKGHLAERSAHFLSIAYFFTFLYRKNDLDNPSHFLIPFI